MRSPYFHRTLERKLSLPDQQGIQRPSRFLSQSPQNQPRRHSGVHNQYHLKESWAQQYLTMTQKYRNPWRLELTEGKLVRWPRRKERQITNVVYHLRPGRHIRRRSPGRVHICCRIDRKCYRHIWTGCPQLFHEVEKIVGVRGRKRVTFCLRIRKLPTEGIKRSASRLRKKGSGTYNTYSNSMPSSWWVFTKFMTVFTKLLELLGATQGEKFVELLAPPIETNALTLCNHRQVWIYFMRKFKYPYIFVCFFNKGGQVTRAGKVNSDFTVGW